jgi:hypothetical protein
MLTSYYTNSISWHAILATLRLLNVNPHHFSFFPPFVSLYLYCLSPIKLCILHW